MTSRRNAERRRHARCGCGLRDHADAVQRSRGNGTVHTQVRRQSVDVDFTDKAVRAVGEDTEAISATGDAVEVLIRFGDQDRRRIVPAANWLADSESGKPIDKVRWVFAGSHRIDKTTLGAELDGTMICVVDFESALIAVDSLHTSENESLWLNAHTKAIPPVGTKCTILIRAANADTAVIATLLSDRSYLVGNQRVSEEQFVAICISKIKGNSKTKIMLNQDDAVSPETINEAIESLVKLGISRHSIVAPEPLKEKPLNADPLKKGKAGAEGDKG